ncbi:uncharacterized protein N7511_006162 [Penicillium nucicola]|uniref:uncharacterized protein n=1 Tax=Penicillium nucicola TaxID=1850975 RepID=UPI00254537D2|nr:uncharacterized protein N7511_006162 [Penicillium nucicola]KAJ5757468.1 hypothetical protein N7511_006162 [Penicillium nucicola]
MSDPLSIAAGIAGFLSLGIQVTQNLVDFYSTYKGQDADIAKITTNMENLQGSFRSLEIAIQQRQSQPQAEELLQDVDKATQRCFEVVKELEAECQRFRTDSTTCLKGRLQVVGRRVTYPFRKSTLQKIEEDVGEIRESLLFALNVLHFKSHNLVEDEISAVRSLLERTNSSQISFIIRAWLQAPDAFINHNAAYAKHHPKTGLWFTDGYSFTNWLVERNSFLWLNGFAGCGKSVLCSAIIQCTLHESEKSDVGIAFYYFAFSDDSKQDAHGMLRALLLQLSVQFPDGEKELEQLCKLSKSSTPSTKALLETLRNFFERFQDSYIVLDALDECPQDTTRDDVLRVIQEIRDWRLPGVHLLVTSRDQLDIRRSLNPNQNCDIPIKSPGIEKDISDFISYQLATDTKLQRWKVRHTEIQKRLTQDAQGVFRYVECQLNSFRRAKNRNQLDESLRTLPRDLDETYERMLCGIDEAYVEDVRRVLTVLSLAIRPLTVDELIDAHEVELGESPSLDREGRSYEENDLVEICLGLIEIVTTDDPIEREIIITDKTDEETVSTTRIVRIAHFSVQEYLQSDRIRQQKAATFAIKRKSANAELTQICLAYLLDPTLSEGVVDEVKLRDFPFAGFAAMYWHRHYQNSEEAKINSTKLMLDIFQNETNSFVTWVRLYAVDRPWEEIPTSQSVEDIASPLYYASFLGLEVVLNTILATDYKSSDLCGLVNAQGGYFGNALQAASWKGHEEVVLMLLDHGADMNAQGGRFGNALQATSSQGHKNVVSMLLDHGAGVNAQGGHFGNALQAASCGVHKDVVSILLDHGADVNTQGGAYGNALQAASYRGNREVVSILLDHGADVNTQGGAYGNALQAASFMGYKEVVSILLDHGADVNAQGGRYGNTLQAASYRGHREVVSILLDHGADVNTQGGAHGNVLQAASYGGHKEVVQMLLDHGADVNAQGGRYGNALHAASDRGFKEAVQMLLDHGAINAQDGEDVNFDTNSS